MVFQVMDPREATNNTKLSGLASNYSGVAGRVVLSGSKDPL